jgi:hypothetical protein
MPFFLKAVGVLIGLKLCKTIAVIEEFPKATSTHRNRFPKATGIDSFTQISDKYPVASESCYYEY